MNTFLPDRKVLLTRLALLATATAGALALPVAPASAALGTNGAATPAITWGACDAALLDDDPDFQCATARVPLDYKVPNGAKIDIALSRLPATGAKLGSVFFNPGGPGASGRSTPRFATPKLRERFDLIGFDPRGTGLSNPSIRCASTSDEAAGLLNPTFPITLLQESTATTKASQGTAGCALRNGAILSHMSSANTARDLELFRKAVGDAKLSFFGFSAGSVIGETYAQLFTSTTRAIVLDSPIDPKKYTTGANVIEGAQPVDYRMKSYLGTDEAVTSFLTACALADGTCAFADPGATPASLRAKFNGVLARVRSRNGVVVDLGEGNGEETVSYQSLIDLVFNELSYGTERSQPLAGYLSAVDLASRGASIPNSDLQDFLSALLHVAHLNDPIDPSLPYDNFIDAFNATLCTDTDHPSLGSTYSSFGRTANNEVAGFGPYWIFTTVSCATWPTRDIDRYTGPWTARPTTPILMLSNKLGDTAARYANAQSGAALTGGRLVGLNAYGHTTYTLYSQCINDVADDYLIDLTVPATGTTCDTDFGPFDASFARSAAVAGSGYARAR